MLRREKEDSFINFLAIVNKEGIHEILIMGLIGSRDLISKAKWLVHLALLIRQQQQQQRLESIFAANFNMVLVIF